MIRLLLFLPALWLGIAGHEIAAVVVGSLGILWWIAHLARRKKPSAALTIAPLLLLLPAFWLDITDHQIAAVAVGSLGILWWIAPFVRRRVPSRAPTVAPPIVDTTTMGAELERLEQEEENRAGEINGLRRRILSARGELTALQKSRPETNPDGITCFFCDELVPRGAVLCMHCQRPALHETRRFALLERYVQSEITSLLRRT